MGMEAVGSLGFPIFHKPRPVARVAEGLLEVVLVELTRPVEGAVTVRIFDEGVRPPEADVAAVFLLYGAEVGRIGRRLEHEWHSTGLRDIAAVRHACYRSYDHPRHYGLVVRSIEALQALHLP